MFPKDEVTHHNNLSNEFAENPPDNYVILYKSVDADKMNEIPINGLEIGRFRPEKLDQNEIHQKLIQIFEDTRISKGVEGFQRDKVLYAHLSLEGNFVNQKDEEIIEIAVDPSECLVCDLDAYTRAFESFIFKENEQEAIEEAKNWADHYWSSAKPLSQVTKQDILKHGDTLEVLIKVDIPKEHIRKHL